MQKAWISELLLLGLLLSAALLLGGLFDHTGWWLAAALAITLARHLFELDRLERWLRAGRRRHPPQSWGVWGEVLEHYYRLQRRYYKRKKRLGRVIREFRESTSAMPDGSIVLDGDFRIKWFNEAAKQGLNLSTQRDMGQPILNLIRSRAFLHYLRSGEYALPVNITSPIDSSRTLSARLIPYGSEQYLLLFRDVTRVQRLEAMRRDFVANASHELRSPITVLSGYLETMGEDKALNEDWAVPLQEMQSQCQRMTSLVDDLLELSRLETEDSEVGDRDVVNVPDLIDRIVNSARVGDRDRHVIELEIRDPVHLAGAEGELHSAFSNLIVNAMRYTPEGGRIEVSWGRDDQGRGVFTVSDNGVGIEEKHLPFITQRFYRVSSSHGTQRSGGTGLGLAIVKHVLQRHGGKLQVQSRLGQGSTFSCLFPPVRLREPAVSLS
jgi:two-component system phosphate regulon sensor histidine kinase PhoR